MRAYQSYNAQPIRPSELAFRTGTTSLKGCASQLGAIDPISLTQGIGKVVGGLRDIFGNLLGSGNRDVHIPAQEHTQDSFAAILDLAEDACRSGRVPRSILDESISGIRRATKEFETFVHTCINEGRCHEARALQGVAEMNALAETIIRDLQNGSVRGCQFEIATGNGGNGGGFLPGTSGGTSSLVPLGILGALAWFAK